VAHAQADFLRLDVRGRHRLFARGGHGEWVFVSGTTGFDYATMQISPDVREQADQALRNIAAALAEAGGSLADVVRVRYIFPDPADFEPCWPILKRHFGEVRPAATMISASLADARMKVEIEVTACRGV
jgi:enamine deaminase RidA (YjgF/YER057c/UK114 family)